MAPYLGLAGFTLFCWFLHHWNALTDRSFLVLVTLPAVAVLGLRGPGVGEDTAMYLQAAEFAHAATWGTLASGGTSLIWNADAFGAGSAMDVGFLGFVKVIMEVTGSPQSVLFICAALTCTGMAFFVYANGMDIPQTYWAFLCGGVYMFAFNGVRQALALAIAVNFYQFARRGLWVRSAVLLVTAFAIHASSIVVVFLLGAALVLRRRAALPWMIASMVVFPFAARLSYPLAAMVSTQFASYYDLNPWTANVGGIVLIWIAIVLCGIYLAVTQASDPESRFLVFSSAAYIAFMVTSIDMVLFERAALYIQPFAYLVFPKVTSALPKNGQLVRIAVSLLMLFLFLRSASSPAREYSLFP